MEHDSWWEKYRPTKIEDVILSPEHREFFGREGFDLNQTSNLLLVGRAGTGKTTLAKILASAHDYIYINASDSNGIDTIRTEISNFVKTMSILGGLKVVVLDEADGLSSVGAGGGSSAQQALRGLMEDNLDTCRFILTANYQHKLIAPLQSRCQTFTLHLNSKQCGEAILKIARAEKIAFEKEELRNLIRAYAPDLRKCINEFQAGCIEGTFKFRGISGAEVSTKVVEDLDARVDVFDIRRELIKIQDTFQSDWHRVMRGIFDLYCARKELKKVLTVAHHMDRDAVVLDKEVNFSAMLFQLSELH